MYTSWPLSPATGVGDKLGGHVSPPRVVPIRCDVVVEADRKQDVRVSLELTLAFSRVRRSSSWIARSISRQTWGLVSDDSLAIRTSLSCNGIFRDISPQSDCPVLLVVPLPATYAGRLKVLVKLACELFVPSAIAEEYAVELERLYATDEIGQERNPYVRQPTARTRNSFDILPFERIRVSVPRVLGPWCWTVSRPLTSERSTLANIVLKHRAIRRSAPARVAPAKFVLKRFAPTRIAQRGSPRPDPLR